MSLGPAQIHAGPKKNIPTESRKHTGTSPTFFAPRSKKKRPGPKNMYRSKKRVPCPGPKNMHPQLKTALAIEHGEK